MPETLQYFRGVVQCIAHLAEKLSRSLYAAGSSGPDAEPVEQCIPITRLVEKLRQKGCLNRCPVESNRRKAEIRITDEGLSLLDALRTNLEQYTQENS